MSKRSVSKSGPSPESPPSEPLGALLQICESLSSENAPDVWFKVFSRAAARVFPVTQWFVFLHDSEKNAVVCRGVSDGVPEEQRPGLLDHFIPVSKTPLLQRVLRQKEPVLLGEDASAESVRSWLKRLGLSSGVAAPLIFHGETVGMLVFGSARKEPAPDIKKADLPTVGVLATMAASYFHGLVARDRVSASEERLASFLDGARDVIAFVDLDGTVRQISPKSLRQILGYEPEEVLGRKMRLFYAYEEDFTHFWKKYFYAGQKVPDEPYECRYKKKNGDTFWVEILPSFVHDDKGNLSGWLCIIRDVTQRKRAEEESKKLQAQFHQSQKMDALGRLTGGVAHDFNNLLTAMIGHLELTKMKMKETDPLQAHIQEISRAADRASKLTRQLLTFSRSQVVVPKVLHINLIVEESRKLLSRLIQENIEIVTDLASKLPRVKVDVGQLEQVIMNLAVNAQDAMLSGGRLTIATRELEVKEAKRFMEMELRPGKYVVLSVSDTGTGMTKEIQEHLFEPFFTTKEPGKGTGLGLATVYGIIKQMSGAIEVRTKPGKGSTFSIYLPTIDAHTELYELNDNAIPEPGTETIFLVEDEPVLRHLNQQILLSKGYKVLVAKDGEEAIELAKRYEEKVDLLLVDVVLPKLDGYQTSLQMKKIYPEMKVLYVSGYTKDVTLEHGVDGGMNFMQKPFTPDHLLNRIREVLDGTERKTEGAAAT